MKGREHIKLPEVLLSVVDPVLLWCTINGTELQWLYCWHMTHTGQLEDPKFEMTDVALVRDA